MEQQYIHLITRAREHDEEAMEELIRIFKPKVIAISREYFLVGADFDDLLQEGMIGLYKAIISYEGSRNHSFSAYASLCIHRQIQNAVKLANRKKNAPLNQYIPINYLGGVQAEDEPMTLIIKDDSDIEASFIAQETNAIVLSKVREILSAEQFALLQLFLNGDTYQHMADKTNKTTKQVDNMIQAIKKKLKTIKGDI